MVEKKKIISIIAGLLGIFAGILITTKGIIVLERYQDLTNILIGLGTTFENLGVNSGLAYLSVALSIFSAAAAIVGSLLIMRHLKIGYVLVLVVAVFVLIGFFVPILDTSVHYGGYTIFVDISLVETMIGIGDPIILGIAGILGLWTTRGK